MDWSTVLDLVVPGTPVQQGSKDAIPLGRYQITAKGRVFVPVTRADGVPIVNVTDNNADRLKPYRQLVTELASVQWGATAPLDEPVSITVEDVFAWRKGDYGTGKNAHVLKPSAPYFKTSKPDVDKLERSVLDALTDAHVLKDDAVVVELHGRKVYGREAHTHIWVARLKADPRQLVLT